VSGLSLLAGLTAVVSLLLSAYLLARLSRPRSLTELGLLGFLYAGGQVLLLGYALSALSALASLPAWCLSNLAGLGLALGLMRWRGLPKAPTGHTLREARDGFRRLPAVQQFMLALLGSATALLGLANLAQALFLAPANWDAMAYHLARMAYYLQQGNLSFFDANYWAQVVHPKNATIWLTYAYLVGQRNENLTQLVQYLAYWMTALAVYGIARRSGCRRSASLASALVFCLLTEALMQATTDQDDLLLAALVAAAVYFLLAYRTSGERRDLFYTAMAVAMALGVKSSAGLALPALVIVGAYAFLAGQRQPSPALRADLPRLLAAGIVCAAAFALPAGYGENLALFGHPVGPPEVRQEHSFEGQPLAYALNQGSKNVLRYGVEFLSFDGVPPLGPVIQVQSALRAPLRKADSILGLKLEDTEATRSPFAYDQWPFAHEDWSYWGIMGFSLVWPAVLLGLLGTTGATSRVLALASVVFLLIQAYAGPYDPWRGRYFLMLAPFAVPCLGALLSARLEKPLLRRGLSLYVAVVVTLGCLSAASAVLLRTNGPLLSLSGQPSVVGTDRIAQLTRSRPAFAETFRRFEEIVPADAVVAASLPADSYEYPLFGAGLTRTIIPINHFRAGPQPPPSNACYLVFQANVGIVPSVGDTDLGNHWYLRKLCGGS